MSNPSWAGRVLHRAVIKVHGPDALLFLQGQFTQELRTDLAPASTYGLWLNQKGRILADSTVLRLSPTEFLLFSATSPAAVIEERLDRYLIADEVTLEDVTSHWAGAVLAGEAGRAWAEAHDTALPARGELRSVGAGWIFPGRRAAGDTWEVLQPFDSGLFSGLPELGEDSLRLARIVAGLPAIPDELGEQDLPNEAGLEQVAISYTKGCYLGQEVMARLHAMGRVRRRLRRVLGRGPQLPSGASLYQDGKVVGTLRTVAEMGGKWVGLAMVSLTGLQPGLGLSGEPAGPATIDLLEGERFS